MADAEDIHAAGLQVLPSSFPQDLGRRDILPRVFNDREIKRKKDPSAEFTALWSKEPIKSWLCCPTIATNDVLEIGYTTHCWGRGYVPVARTLIDLAFKELGLHRGPLALATMSKVNELLKTWFHPYDTHKEP